MKPILKFASITLFWMAGQFILAQDECNYASKGNNMIPNKLCAPVTANWSVSYGGVTYTGPGLIQIYFNWDDGTVPTTVNATFNASTGQWEASQTHVYPKGGNRCNYNPTTMLVVNGIQCTSSIQTQIVTVWDVDDQNGGILHIAPAIYPICFGQSGATYFNDASLWNCVPPAEYDTRNNFRRWTQWIYGTGGTTISTARVGGAIRSYPYTGAITATTQPIEGPQPPHNRSMYIEIPAGYNVGDYFEVTLRNWNYCNPYDDPTIPGAPADPINGDNPPIEITAIALIVALPDGTITAVGPFCQNNPPVTLTAATPGGIWAGPGITNSTTGVFNPAVAGPGIHPISYNFTDPNGCSASGTTQVEVWGSPDVSLSLSSPGYLCPGVTQPIDARVFNGTSPYTAQWVGNTGPLNSTNIFNPLFQTTVTGIYNLQLLVTDQRGCKNSTSLSITVSPVSVNFNPPNIEVCQFSNVTLQPVAAGGTRNYVTHEWSGPDIAKLSDINIANPILNTDLTGVFTFSYRVTDDQGCTDSNTITVTIKEQPIANAGPDAPTCNLNYTLTGNTWAGTTGFWSMVSGPGTSTISSPTSSSTSLTVNQTGVYRFNWEINLNGCISNDEVEINFAQLPNPRVIPDFPVCGTTAQIISIPDISGGTWLFDSGPGNVTFDDPLQPTTMAVVDQPGAYRFTWRESSGFGCRGEATLQINFMPQSEAIVDPLPILGCSPYEVTFPNNSLNADFYKWNLGGGLISTATNPVQVYDNFTTSIRTLEITLIAGNTYGCNDTLKFDLQVAPKPYPRAMAVPAAGCAPLETKFINLTTGATGYRWNFMDGTPYSTEPEPNHTFANTNNFIRAYPVMLYAENSFGCTDSVTTYITVFPSSPLSISVNPVSGCHPLNAIFSTTPGYINYNWDFGDGNSVTGGFQISHIFNNTTDNNLTYNILLMAVNPFNCISTAMQQVTVFPSPVAAFNVTPTVQHMPSRTVNITNQTTGSNWSYLWNFGDGTTSGAQNPGTHTYPGSGIYRIELNVTNGQCSNFASREITINPMLPQINYGANPSSGCPPLTVNFSNTTLDATTFLWEFGDGIMSQQRQPTHTYYVPGTYKVKLTASGPGGISFAENLDIIVFDKPLARFEIIPRVIYIPGEKPVFINRSIGATIYEWNFGDGNVSGEFSPVYQYQQPGIYTVSLWVNNNFGCEDFFSLPQAIKVEQGGEISFPNAFTPNPSGSTGGKYRFGDPKNYIFYPFVQKGIVEYLLQIFTRWGELIFESDDIEIGWDGYLKGKAAPQGVYIWRARYKTANGKVEIRAGDVTLIR